LFNILLTVHLDNLSNENQLDALFILNYFVRQSLNVTDVFVAHHQEVFTVYVQQLLRVIRLGDWELAGSGWKIEFHPDTASYQTT
jgi:hypothetical protein